MRRATLSGFVLASFLFVGCGEGDVTTTELGSSTLGTHSWNGYHWARTANPFTLQLGNNLSSVWQPYLATTSSDWSQSTVLDTTIAAGGSSQRRCKPTTGRVEVCNSTYGNNGWLGVAQVWASGSHITQATVKLNDTYFNTTKYNTSAWRNLVSCQETGHTLGLDHQDTNFDNPNLGTCMDYTNDPSTNQHPNKHDYDELQIIYSHDDTTTTVAGMPAAMSSGDFEDRSSWGVVINSHNGGRQQTFVRDFGGGHQLWTFVTWAE